MFESLGLSSAQVGILNAIAFELSKIPGAIAVALGGSHARRTARPDSDLDVGLYYSKNSPPDIETIRCCAERISVPCNLCLRLMSNIILVTKAVWKRSIAFPYNRVVFPTGSGNY